MKVGMSGSKNEGRSRYEPLNIPSRRRQEVKTSFETEAYTYRQQTCQAHNINIWYDLMLLILLTTWTIRLKIVLLSGTLSRFRGQEVLGPQPDRMEASVTDDVRRLEHHGFSGDLAGELNRYVSGISESSVLGIAICDAQFRYVSVNRVLAAMNGVPAEAHIGKTVREVIGRVASTVEPILHSVLVTGQNVLNVEIVGEPPARNEQGHWIANYFPIKTSTGEVQHVGILVIEITRLRKFERCLLALMANLPSTADSSVQPHMPIGGEKESSELRNGSIELLESCVREMFRDHHWLQPPAQKPSVGDLATYELVTLPHAPVSTLHDSSTRERPSAWSGDDGTKALSPREIEIVQLLAGGKSNKEISTALTITVRTVESYRAKIMLKLHIHSVIDLVRYAVRTGLIKA
jgi:DNA-binding CsgD family transcriptional regulator/PAS domain-containing protein